MRIASVEAIPLAAELSATFRFGTVDRKTSANVLVRLADDDGAVGWGEACPVPQLTAETQETVVALVEQRLKPLLLGRDATAWRPLMRLVRGHVHQASFTLAAVETAVLDLVARSRAVSIADLLGGRSREEVELHGSVGWDEDPGKMADQAAQQAERFRVLKLYAGRGTVEQDIARLRRAREAVGPAHPFILDVNGLWTCLDARMAAPSLAELGVCMVEQPVAAADTRGQAEVTAMFRDAHGIAVVADEAVRAPADASKVGELRLATGVNVGVSKLGGITAALDTATVAAASHLDVAVGSVVELGVATAAGLQLAAALPDMSYPAYLMGPQKYASRITSSPLDPVDGVLRLPSGPGLGIEIDQDEVARLDRRRAA